MPVLKTLRGGNNEDEVFDKLTWSYDGEEGQWDLCIAIDVPPKPGKAKAIEAWEKKQAERGGMIADFKRAGLLMVKRVSVDKKTHFFLISATQERLELMAEVMELEMQMQPKFGGGYAPFTRENKSIFLGAFNDQFFSPTQRQHIVRNIIELDGYEGGANHSLWRLTKKGVIKKAFPFHVPTTRAYLFQSWAHWRLFEWWKPQPLHILRDYFGEELSLYFAWLEFYNYSLVVPAIFGTVVFGLQSVDGLNGWPNVVYSMYMMLWTTFFLEFWKRKQNVLAFEWNMLNFESSETSRPDYYGEEKLGVHSQGQWVEFDEDDPALEVVTVTPSRHYPKKLNKYKMFASAWPLAMTLLIVIVIVLVVLALRLWFQKNLEAFGGGVIGSVIGAVLIIVFNVLYKVMAVKLNDWENHRTQTEYDDNLIIKTILFQFVNTFTSLFYISFAKSGFRFFDAVPDLIDACKTTWEAEDKVSGDVIGSGCISELTLQLITLMALNLVIGQVKEIMIPLAKVWLKAILGACGMRGAEEEVVLEPWESEAQLEDFAGTFDEYAEMAIQFGLVTTFAVAFPLAPLFALANNFVEIRTDAIKILMTNNKPYYKGAQDIGGWYQILDIMSFVSVVTNSLLLGLGFPAVPLAVGTGKLGTSFNTLILCFAIEHALIVGKYILAEIIPDMPGDVLQKLARQEFLKEETLKQLDNRPSFNLKPDPEAGANFDYQETYAEGEIIPPDELVVTYSEEIRKIWEQEAGLKLSKSKKKAKKNKTPRSEQ